jgi:hypothetical protein
MASVREVSARLGGKTGTTRDGGSDGAPLISATSACVSADGSMS